MLLRWSDRALVDEHGFSFVTLPPSVPEHVAARIRDLCAVHMQEIVHIHEEMRQWIAAGAPSHGSSPRWAKDQVSLQLLIFQDAYAYDPKTLRLLHERGSR